MPDVSQHVQEVQIRQQRQWLWQCVSVGLLVGGSIGISAALVRILMHGAFSWLWIIGLMFTPVVVAACIAIVKSRTMLLAARTIDSQCGLKDRTETALQFLESDSSDSPLRRLQLRDAENHLRSIDPVKVAPIRAPKSWNWGLLTTVIACVLCFITGHPEQVSAAAEINSVVSAQADRASVGIEELEKLQQVLNDPELEETLTALAEQLSELKAPGLDPREALAKLSEMESALQEMQQQIAEASNEAQLKEIGDALSLAEAMAAAGQAMAAGEMDKAAEELSQLELPKLDRKTEKAVTEKLEQAQNNKNAGSKMQSLKEAVQKAAEGLSSGNANKFQDGMKGLAGECKKQGRKKKLSDLLKKQCQCLSECKSECESECRSQAQSNRKGGTKAGKGSADLNGDKTGKQKTGSEMNLKGEDSGTGDSDVETEKDSHQQSEAVRQYRKNAEKYEALSESVLESESIPLGHRQTIRRYFEMIRPSASETDVVNDATDVKSDEN